VTPFDRKKAAEYLVVAWVKDWRMWTYLKAINAWDVRFEDIHDMYPWMPAHDHLNRYMKNAAIRPWVAFSMKAINDKLFDAEDNKARLALASRIEKWNSLGATNGFAHKEAEKERVKDRKQYKRAGFEHKLSMELMRKGSGHHWNIVK
jgi:hypothetical protein